MIELRFKLHDDKKSNVMEMFIHYLELKYCCTFDRPSFSDKTYKLKWYKEDSIDMLKNMIDFIYEQKLYPYSDFADLRSYDYDLIVNAKDVNEIHEFIRIKDNEIINAKLDMISTIINDLASRQNVIATKLETLESFLAKSGAVYQPQIITSIIDCLKEAKIASKDLIKRQLELTYH